MVGRKKASKKYPAKPDLHNKKSADAIRTELLTGLAFFIMVLAIYFTARCNGTIHKVLHRHEYPK